MTTRTVTALYGTKSQNTKECFIYETNGGSWYALEGSQSVNFTYEEIKDGTNVECLHDVDHFQWDEDINSEEDLVLAVEN